MPVGSPGSIITRGLGSGLLVTRGYGRALALVIEEIVIDAPRGSAARRDGRLRPDEQEVCYTVRASLVRVDGRDLKSPLEGVAKACFMPGATVNAQMTDVLVTQLLESIRVEATLSEIIGVPVKISASIPIVTETTENVVVRAEVKGSQKAPKDVFIAVKRIVVKEEGSDE